MGQVLNRMRCMRGRRKGRMEENSDIRKVRG